MKVIIAIPARYFSKRFPGKLLALIKGKTMIERVYEKAKNTEVYLKSKYETEVIIATDDERIKRICEKLGANVVMTPSDLPSGTDRIYYVLKDEYCDYILNLQGDEPLIYEKDLQRLIEESIENGYLCSTLIYKSTENIEDLNTVKVVIDKDRKALYFSRASIPFGRDCSPPFYYKHIGVYMYRKDILKKFVELKESYLEKVEKLEQLRLIENGIPVYCVFAERDTISVDKKEDIEKVEKVLENFEK